jgi:hypothetical protein
MQLLEYKDKQFPIQTTLIARFGRQHNSNAALDLIFQDSVTAKLELTDE